MRVLKKGSVPKKWIGECSYCSSIIELSRDVDMQFDACYPDISFKRRCPICKTSMIDYYREDCESAKKLYNKSVYHECGLRLNDNKIDLNKHGRRKGNTFRKSLLAVILASSGNNVLYIKTYPLDDYQKHYIIDILRSCNIEYEKRGNNDIVIHDGFIKIISKQQYEENPYAYRGVKYIEIFD